MYIPVGSMGVPLVGTIEMSRIPRKEPRTDH